MCIVWTMTYDTNYSLTTVRKLIFSAGHKTNRHSDRNIYPPIIQVKIPIDWVLPMNIGMNVNTPKKNSMRGTRKCWSAHISPSEWFVTVSHTDYSNKFAVLHFQFIWLGPIKQIFGAHSIQFCVNRRIGNTKNRDVQFLHKYIIATRVESVEFVCTLHRICL